MSEPVSSAKIELVMVRPYLVGATGGLQYWYAECPYCLKVFGGSEYFEKRDVIEVVFTHEKEKHGCKLPGEA